VANDPDVAFLAALHVLTLKLFYPYPLDSCVDIEPKRLTFGAHIPGLADTASARAIETRHAGWAAQLPKGPGELVTRWRLTIEYDGAPFMGWQRQEHGPSVQQALEEALSKMTGEKGQFTAAGRTDAGVHALAMTAHTDVTKPLTAHRLGKTWG